MILVDECAVERPRHHFHRNEYISPFIRAILQPSPRRRTARTSVMTRMNFVTAYRKIARSAFFALVALSAASCATTSGSSRLDKTGEKISDATGYELSDKPEPPAFYLQALRGGLVARMPGVKLSDADRARALEAEYKALEAAPNGQAVVWSGNGLKGEVTAAAPYQVGSQNCRQYSHVLAAKAGPVTARGAACRMGNGAWTPLT
jgi:surface antigen